MNKKLFITPQDFQQDADKLAGMLQQGGNHFTGVYGVPRGGVPLAAHISLRLNIPIYDTPAPGVLIVDDLIDSGATLQEFYEQGYTTAVLYKKKHSPDVATHCVKTLDGWIEFFYEQTEQDSQHIITRLLEHIGEDPTREGLLDTPKRVLKFYKEFLSPPVFNFTVFDSESYDEMIIQKNIPFFSLCEHHIAPFFGYATVAYIPNGKIVGLSKLTRTVEYYSRRLQNQERITNQIAERLQAELDPIGVAVTLSARHFCMEMRGVRTHDVYTKTTKLIGAFKDKPEARQEFLNG